MKALLGVVQAVIHDGAQVGHAIRQQLRYVGGPHGDGLYQGDFSVTPVPRLAGVDGVGESGDVRCPSVAIGRLVQALGQVAAALVVGR